MQKFKKIFSSLLKIFCGFLISYVLIYAILSTAGRYEKEPVGHVGSDFGILWWAPLGFYNSNRVSQCTNVWSAGWNKPMVYTFYPLFKLDLAYIHKNALGSGE
jgi:hypothetical protein